MSDKKKVLITGASGFIGKSLLNQIDYDVYDVSVLTRNPQKFKDEMRFSIIKGDLLDISSLKKALQGVHILVNLAAEVRNQDKLEVTNVGGTKNLIEAISKEPAIERVIHLSSVGVVGMNYSQVPVIIDEHFTPDPKNEYERTKLLSEKLFVAYLQQSTLKWSILRPTNVFGPHHPFDALLNLMHHIQNGKRMLLTTHSKVNYVYVDDLTASVVNQLTAEKKDIYNVGNSMDLEVFVRIIARELSVSVKITSIPKWVVGFLRLLKIHKLDTISNEVIYSDKALRSVFSYPVGVEEGIRRTVLYYKQLNKLS